jgi:hypothetical protein
LASFQINVIFLVRVILSVWSKLGIQRNNKLTSLPLVVFLSVFSCFLISSLPSTPLIKIHRIYMNISAVAHKVCLFFGCISEVHSSILKVSLVSYVTKLSNFSKHWNNAGTVLIVRNFLLLWILTAFESPR